MLEKPFSKIYPQRWVQIALLIIFCFFLFFVNLNRWDLWNPDEPRHVQVAREMVDGGDWVLMHFNGKTYGDNPPLLFWLIAFSSYFWQGFNSFSVRFPSALRLGSHRSGQGIPLQARRRHSCTFESVSSSSHTR